MSILALQADVIAIIFTIVMLDCFNDFANLFWVWHRSQTLQHIRDVLHRMDWNSIYQFHAEPNEIVLHQFNNFIGTCVEVDIVPAKFYNSCKKLFLIQDVPHNLFILQQQSMSHFPSYFSYLVFQAIYKPFENDKTVVQMKDLVKRPEMRLKLGSIITLLQGFYNVEEDKLLPRNKICPHARNRVPFDLTKWPPSCEDIWFSLCDETVDEHYLESNGIIARPLTMDHILHSRCSYCSLQIILFKILIGGYLYY